MHDLWLNVGCYILSRPPYRINTDFQHPLKETTKNITRHISVMYINIVTSRRRCFIHLVLLLYTVSGNVELSHARFHLNVDCIHQRFPNFFSGGALFWTKFSHGALLWIPRGT